MGCSWCMNISSMLVLLVVVVGRVGAQDALEIVAPEDGAALEPGDTVTIAWSPPVTGDRFRLELSTDDGASWRAVSPDATGSSTRWVVPNTPSSAARLRAQRIVDTIDRRRFDGERVDALRLSRDGRFLFTTSKIYRSLLWDTRTMRIIRDLGPGGRTVPSGDFSPDCRYLAFTRGDSIAVLDLEADSIVASVSGPGPVRFHPNGRVFASPRSHSSNTVSLRDVRGGQEIRFFDNYLAVTALAFSDDARLFVAAGTLRIFESSVNNLQIVQLMPSGTEGLAVDARGEHMLSTDGWEVNYWDLRIPRTERSVVFAGAFGDNVAVSRDGRHMAAASRNGIVTLLRPGDAAVTREIGGAQGWALDVDFTADGLGIAIADWRGASLVTFERTVGEPAVSGRFSIERPRVRVEPVRFAPVAAPPVRALAQALVTVRNESRVPIVVRSVVEGGGDTADFSAQHVWSPIAIGPGASMSHLVWFHPTAIGVRGVEIVIVTDVDTLRTMALGTAVLQPVQAIVDTVHFRDVGDRETKTRVVRVVRNADSVAHDVTVAYDSRPWRDEAFTVIEGLGTYRMGPGAEMAIVARFIDDGNHWDRSQLLSVAFDGFGSPLTISLHASWTGWEPPWWSVEDEPDGRMVRVASRVQPTPAAETATLLLGIKRSDRVEVRIMDMRGVTVARTGPIDVHPGDVSIPLHLSGIDPGVYLVHVSGGHLVSSSRMVVVAP